ncbi:hypothetical protein [Streptomyces sp. NPDC054783]
MTGREGRHENRRYGRDAEGPGAELRAGALAEQWAPDQPLWSFDPVAVFE